MIRPINSRFAAGFLFLLLTGVLAGLSGGLIARPERDVRNSGKAAFQRTLDFATTVSPSFAVPAGNRLALMFVGATMVVATGQQPLISVKTTVGGSTVEYPLILTRQMTNPSGSDVYVCSQSLAGIFADGGTEVIVNGKTASSKSFNGKIALGGSFVE
jgi:hypothetical protein